MVEKSPSLEEEKNEFQEALEIMLKAAGFKIDQRVLLPPDNYGPIKRSIGVIGVIEGGAFYKGSSGRSLPGVTVCYQAGFRSVDQHVIVSLLKLSDMNPISTDPSPEPLTAQQRLDSRAFQPDEVNAHYNEKFFYFSINDSSGKIMDRVKELYGVIRGVEIKQVTEEYASDPTVREAYKRYASRLDDAIRALKRLVNEYREEHEASGKSYYNSSQMIEVVMLQLALEEVQTKLDSVINPNQSVRS